MIATEFKVQNKINNTNTLLSSKVTKEYDDYKANLLKLSIDEIISESGQIHFYECITNYFTNGDTEIEEDVVTVLLNSEINIISFLYYNVYLKYDNVSYLNHEDIDYMLSIAIDENYF